MNMKTAFIVGGLFIFSLSCFGFTGQTRKVYDGPSLPSEQLAHFEFHGNGFAQIGLYKIDGKTCTDTTQRSNIQYTDYKGSFSVDVLPGSHTFEFVALKKQKPERCYQITFTLAANEEYEYKENGDGYEVIQASNKSIIAAEEKAVPFYSEPGDSEPNGTLIQTKESRADKTFTVFRVDGLPGQVVPKVGGYNYFVGVGNYAIKLTPGTHTVEYIFVIGSYFSKNITSQTITIEEGKQYQFVVENIDAVKKSGVNPEIRVTSVE